MTAPCQMLFCEGAGDERNTVAIPNCLICWVRTYVRPWANYKATLHLIAHDFAEQADRDVGSQRRLELLANAQETSKANSPPC